MHVIGAVVDAASWKASNDLYPKKFCTPEQGSGLRYANSFLFVYVSVNEYICIVFKDALRGRNLVPIASIEILDGAVLGS